MHLSQPKKIDMITLKQICSELKLDQREARERLRNADAKKYPALKDRKPRTPWQWEKRSDGEKQARALLSDPIAHPDKK